MARHRSTIDNLPLAGHELSEAHLALAAGGVSRVLRGGRFPTTYSVAPTYRDERMVDSCTDPVIEM